MKWWHADQDDALVSTKQMTSNAKKRKPPRTRRVDSGLASIIGLVEADISAMEDHDRPDFNASDMEHAIEWLRATIKYPPDGGSNDV